MRYIPSRSLGWKDFEKKDKEVAELVEKMKSFPDRFILLNKPVKDFIAWFRNIQEQYGIEPHIWIEKSDPFVMQNRYQADDGSEIFYIVHSISIIHTGRKLSFRKRIVRNRQAWIFNPEDGKQIQGNT